MSRANLFMTRVNSYYYETTLNCDKVSSDLMIWYGIGLSQSECGLIANHDTELTRTLNVPDIVYVHLYSAVHLYSTVRSAL